MKRSIVGALTLCVTTSFVAGTAWAQDNRSTIGDAAQSPGTQPVTPAQTRPASSGIFENSVSATASRSGQPVRLSQLMNGNLRGQTGDSYGKVQDIIVDPSSGQAQFVIVSLSGSANRAASSATAATTSGTSIGSTASGQLVAIPFQMINSSGSSDFTALVDRTTLQSAPTFNNSSWPTMDSQWSQRVNSHFGVSPTSTGAPGSSTGTGVGNGLRNTTTPGVPATPGTPDIYAPGTRPGGLVPGSGVGTGTRSGTGTGTGTGTSGSGSGAGSGGAGGAGGSGGGK